MMSSGVASVKHRLDDVHPLSAWVVCISAALFFFYEFIQGNMFASISVDVMKSFHIGIVQNGYLSSVYYLSNVIFLFPAGVVLDRCSTKRVILSSMILCIFGTFLFSFSESYTVALFCRFVTGIGSAFCFLSCIRLASRWFKPDHMALVVGVIVTLAMCGGMVAQTPLTALINHFGWRHAVFYDGMLGIVLLLIILCLVEDKPFEGETDSPLSSHHEPSLGFFASIRKAYSYSQNIFAAVFTSLMNMPVAVLGAFIGSMYLTQAHHYLRLEAASINSMIFLGTIFGGPLVGYWSDIIHNRKRPMLICNILSLVCVVMILGLSGQSVLMMKVLFFLLGFFTSAQVIAYPLVAENNDLSRTATAVSVVSVFSQGGFIVYQNLFSYLLWHFDDIHSPLVHSAKAYQTALLIIPLGFVIAFFACLLLKETHGVRIEDRES